MIKHLTDRLSVKIVFTTCDTLVNYKQYSENNMHHIHINATSCNARKVQSRLTCESQKYTAKNRAQHPCVDLHSLEETVFSREERARS